MSAMHAPASHRAANDQAAGLRRLFGDGGHGTRFVPLVSNPFVASSGALIERLVAAFAATTRAHTLLVDAADSAPPPRDIVGVDLAEGIERLSPHASYIAARGLPRRHVDARGRSTGLLHALADVAPHAQVVLVHAGASDLWRLFLPLQARPIVLAGDHPAAVTHAYAELKLLAQRASLRTHDLLLGAAAASPRAERIAAQLASCAERFLGGLQCGWAAVDPTDDADALPPPALLQLAHDALVPGPAAAEAALTPTLN
jgi:hypothetical protein